MLRVPFEHVIPKEERDPAVKRALRNPQRTGAAILAWAVQGCLAWQREGLGVPPLVEAATQELRQEMDPLRDFFDDCCILRPEAWVLTADLRQAYETWARERGEAFVLRGRQFTDRLKARGLEPERRHAGRGWQGIGLLTAALTAPGRPERDGTDTGENSSKLQKNSPSVTDGDGEISNSKLNSPHEGELSKRPSRGVTRHGELADAGDEEERGFYDYLERGDS
jgi:putative DNA primase/helicase